MPASHTLGSARPCEQAVPRKGSGAIGQASGARARSVRGLVVSGAHARSYRLRSGQASPPSRGARMRPSSIPNRVPGTDAGSSSSPSCLRIGVLGGYATGRGRSFGLTARSFWSNGDDPGEPRCVRRWGLDRPKRRIRAHSCSADQKINLAMAKVQK